MILNCKDGQVFVPYTLNGVVKEVDVGYLHLFGSSVRVYGEVVVLGGYLYPARS